jgi:hypothetical protein
MGSCLVLADLLGGMEIRRGSEPSPSRAPLCKLNVTGRPGNSRPFPKHGGILPGITTRALGQA